MRRTDRSSAPRARLAVLLLMSVGLLCSSLATSLFLGGVDAPEAVAQSRSVTVSPAAARAGERVTVRWTGFTPGAPVSVFQCRFSEPVSWESACPEVTWTAGTTGPDGTGQVSFVVWQYTLQELGGNNSMFCGRSGCDLAVTECDTQLNAGQYARTPIQVDPGGTNPIEFPDEEAEFASMPTVATAPGSGTAPPFASAAPTAQAVAAGERTSLNVRSGQAMDPLLEDLAVEVEAKGIELNSTVVNSPSSIEAFVAGQADLALSARPLSAGQQAELEAAGRPAVMVPVAASPQVLIHNIDVRGVPIQRFRLSVDSMAKLYRSLIVGVDSAELRADNGGCGITQSGRTTDRSVLGFFRTDRSSANYTFSNWLRTASGRDGAGLSLWPPPNAVAPSEQFPTADTGRSRSDNAALAEFIRVGSEPGASTQITNEAGRLRLGFVDQSAVLEMLHILELLAPFGPDPRPGEEPIRYVELANASGNWVRPTNAGVTATLAASTIEEDNSVTVNPSATAASAWPLVSVIYALVPAAPSGSYTPEKAVAGKRFVEHLLSDEGQTTLSSGGMTPLDGELKTRSVTALDSIDTPAAPTPTTLPPGPGPGSPEAPPTFDGGFDGDFTSGGFGDDFTSGGFGDDFSDGGLGDDFSDGGFGDDTEVLGGEESADGATEEATGDSVINSSSSLLDGFAGAPALVLVLVLGIAAAVVGQVLRGVDRRKRQPTGDESIAVAEVGAPTDTAKEALA